MNQGQRLQNRYRLSRLLGSGGFGAVYLATDERLNRQVAIKAMSDANLEADQHRLAMSLFEREAMMLAQLTHPSLTRIWDYFEEDDQAYLVMEYVPGLTLRDLQLQLGDVLPESFVISCGIQLCSVLHYLHNQQPAIIFRDLKPANIMVMVPENLTPPEIVELASNEIQIKLIDFGIARHFRPGQQSDTDIIATPGFAAPEQYGQEQTNPRSDIYSLGATLYQLLSNQRQMTMPLRPLREFVPFISEPLSSVIERATQMEPLARYPNALSMRTDLQALVKPSAKGNLHAVPSRRPNVIPAPNSMPTPPARSGRAPLLLIVVLVVVVSGISLLAIFLQSQSTPTQAQATPTTTPVAQRDSWWIPNAQGTLSFGQNTDNGYILHTSSLDGNTKALSNIGNITASAWSSDGQLAVTRLINNQSNIWYGTAQQPTAFEIKSQDNARYPAWSPSNRQIAFALQQNGIWKLASYNLDTQRISLLGPERIGWVSWGIGALVYAAQDGPGQPQDIYALDVSGTPRNLTATDKIEEDFPARSPDGRKIAFVGNPVNSLDQRHIYVMNADGSRRTQLTTNTGPHTNPVWSPDGQWIAYLSKANGSDWQVWVMRADGTEAHQISNGSEQKFYLAWGSK